ncbi:MULTISPECIES: hypothetical protein [Pseudomonas]|jgi:hypothetical protein|uniref:Uncharacterized protein n=2 Tax=Pseudomonas fluorescens TaxID=294 RepID=A0ABY1TFR3_PSEFL|nr:MULTISPECIES: hypothetical protein [Pseudomonas]MEA3168808.1 hypothetical protein [Pseudomonas sp.]MBC8786133.1 hypothetical protein [Pseudomonas fluorescens]MBK5544302.1 hypothetical protein [Pseudomonas sp. TH04]MCI4605932.1 hypothetical protein [Pseudomonas fluorescens]NNB71378.1 hypothetical protein [Pseudomonas fluorescens]
MLRFLAFIVFMVVLLPVGLTRSVLHSSRFGRRFHQAPSAWDHAVKQP